MKKILSEGKTLVVETWHEWNDDDAMQWGAAVSYYAALSLAPLLVTVLAVAGLAFETDDLRRSLVDQLGQWIGQEGAQMAQEILSTQGGQTFAGVTSGVLALIGATAVFGQLQKALNQLWDVRGEGGIRRMLKTRLLGFVMIFCFGILFLAALALQAVVAALPEWGPSGRLLNLGGSVALFTLLFAAIYQILPDVDIRWRDVWVGAAVTAVLFSLGQLAVGLYLGRSSVGSSYGAAGSLVAVLVWLYYSSVVVFFGAEFTQVWARRRGRRIRPTRGAYRIETKRVERKEGRAPDADAREAGEGVDRRRDRVAAGSSDRETARDEAAERDRRAGGRTGDKAVTDAEETEREPDARHRNHPPHPRRTSVRGKISYP